MAKNIIATLKEMEVGDELRFTEGNFNSIIASASTYGFQWQRKFRCNRSREDYSLTVTRIS